MSESSELYNDALSDKLNPLYLSLHPHPPPLTVFALWTGKVVTLPETFGIFFHCSRRYLISAVTVVVTIVLLTGSNDRKASDNKTFWDLKNGTDILAELGTDADAVNCSGVLFNPHGTH